jgi:enterochelin esterase-like enzyme
MQLMRQFKLHSVALLPIPLILGLAMPAPVGAQGDVPKGEVTKYTFNKSKIFPGTTRDYWVYVPRQYDPAKPACVYVNQDGVQFNAPAVFDQLIHKKEMPVVIAVFVQPGRVKAPSGKELDRFNRSFEYDGLGDNYARFLLEELLPDVETKQTSDGRAIKLSKSGNDRAIGGSSSGAVCAFTAAWERPDAFCRVFSAIGTYVGLRGANVYPTLIRKFEPKPIRVFLQDGSKDLNIYGGDWWMANQEMERALTFSGYEVNHEWGDGGHDGKHATQIFPEAMKWLWKDWPAPVKAGHGSPQLKDILVPTEDWKLVDKDSSVTCLAANAKGEVFLSYWLFPTYKLGLDGKLARLPYDTGWDCQGLAFGPDSRVYVVGGMFGQGVRAFGDDGKCAIIAEGTRGGHIIVRHDGNIYVTDPVAIPTVSTIWHISPRGKKLKVDLGLKYATGVTLSPDQSLLYVADGGSHWVYSYQIQPDGSLSNKQKFYHLHVADTADKSGAGGMCVDRDGRLYVATTMGIQVCDQAGRVNCIIPTPNGRATDVCIGGVNFDTLFAACGDRVYQRKLKVKGANAFEAPIKPAPPKL